MSLVVLHRECVMFGLARRVKVIELAGEYVAQRGDDVLRNLHAPVVVLDLLLDIVDRHGLPGAGGALGVWASEVEVEVAVAVLGVVDHEPGGGIAAVNRAFRYCGILPVLECELDCTFAYLGGIGNRNRLRVLVPAKTHSTKHST